MTRALTCMSLMFFCAVSRGQEADLTFAPVYKTGQVIRDQTRYVISNKSEHFGGKSQTSVEQDEIVVETVGKRRANGNIKVEGRLDLLNYSLNMDGMRVKFDSRKPEESISESQTLHELLDFLQRRAYAEWTATYDKKGMFKSFAFKENPFDGISEAYLSTYKLENQQESKKEEMNQLPGKVKFGETWKRTEKIKLNQNQQMELEVEYTYEGPQEEEGKSLELFTQKVLSVKAISGEMANPDVKLVSSKLEGGESRGEFLFDAELGRVVKATKRLVIKGEVTVSLYGMEVTSNIEAKIEMDSRLTVNEEAAERE